LPGSIAGLFYFDRLALIFCSTSLVSIFFQISKMEKRDIALCSPAAAHRGFARPAPSAVEFLGPLPAE